MSFTPATKLLGAAALSASVLFAPSADACVCYYPPPLTFKINTASFVAAFADENPGLNADQVEWAILNSLSKWIDQTGAGITLSYQGRTTDTVNCITPSFNGETVIAAEPTNTGNVIGPIGVTWGEDICLDSRQHFYFTEYIPTAAYNFDIESVLNHEMGHRLLGGAHYNRTTMASGVVSGNTIGRTLTGTDIKRARGAYPPYTGCCWYPGSGTAFRYSATPTWWTAESPSTIMPANWNGAPPATAMGRHGYGDTVVVSRNLTATAGSWQATGLGFSRASAGTTVATSFTEAVFVGTNYESYHSPAIAARASGSALWLAAIAGAHDLDYQCSAIRVARSTNAFSTVSSITTLANDCSSRAPAMAYDPTSGRFVLLYTYETQALQTQTSDPGDVFNDAVVARTSLDGISWTAPQVLSKSTDAPSVACIASKCVMTTTSTASTGGNVPFTHLWNFYVNGSGSLVFTSLSVDYTPQANRVAISAAGTGMWMSEWRVPSWDLGAGPAETLFSSSPAAPLTGYTTLSETMASPTLSGSVTRSDAYVFYTK